MVVAFRMSKDDLPLTTRPFIIHLKSGDIESQDITTLLGGSENGLAVPIEGRRAYVDIAGLAKFGFHVRYDSKNKVVLARYQDESACIAFRPDFESRKVLVIYNKTPWRFDGWWRDSHLAKPLWGLQEMIVAEATLAPIMSPDYRKNRIYLPLRVIGGALNIRPDKDVLYLHGHRSQPAKVILKRDPRASQSFQGSYDDKSKVHSEVLARLGVH
jgi:hypothetical protein